MGLRILTVYLSLLLLPGFSTSGQTDKKANLVVETGLGGLVYSVAFSRDGNLLATGTGTGDVKLWNAQTGNELRRIEQSGSESISFSPDGTKLLISGGGGEILLIDVLSGKEVWSKKALRSTHTVFHPTENVIIEPSPRRLLVVDPATGQVIKSALDSASEIVEFAFSADGKSLASRSTDGKVKLWDVNALTEMAAPIVPGGNISTLALSPDGKLILVGRDDGTVAGWDTASREKLFDFAPHTDRVRTLAIPKAGGTFASGGDDNYLRFWNLNSRGRHGEIDLQSNVLSSSLSPDGEQLMVGLWGADRNEEKPSAALLDVATGKAILKWNTRESIPHDVRVNRDKSYLAFAFHNARTVDIGSGTIRSYGDIRESATAVDFDDQRKELVAATGNMQIHRYSIDSGRRLNTLNPGGQVELLAISPDSKMLAFAMFADFGETANSLVMSIGVSSAGVAETRKVLGNHTITGVPFDLRFSPDGEELALMQRDRHVVERLWLVKTGQEIAVSKTTPAWAYGSAHGSPKFPEVKLTDKGLEIGRAFGGVSIASIETGEEKARIIPVGQEDWAVVTPNGLFDASPNARKSMYFVQGLEMVRLEQMKDAYYVPGLLKKVLNRDPLPKVELFSKKDLFPEVEFEQPKSGQKDLPIKLVNRGGGIGVVQVLVNGKEFVKDARGANFDPLVKTPVTLSVSLKGAPFIAGAENKIEVIARNASGSLTNRGTARGAKVFTVGGAATKETPNIYAIVGGISDYTGDGLKLNFAAKDAEDFAKALELGAVKMLGDKSKVHLRLLTSNGDKSAAKFISPDAKVSTATKADFERAFADFKGATPNDLFIVYLAGHGVSLNLNQNPNQVGGDTYLYLTQEATTTDKSVLTAENSRKAMTMSSEELKDQMKQNSALKQVLILDTCASGAAANSLVTKRDLPSDQIAAIERLKDNTGFFVLMGSSADAVSYEASQFGQGLLTYSLLKAMDGEKLRPGGYADINELFTFAKQQVPQFAKNIGGIQQPLSITPDVAGTFDIGRFTADEQAKIVLNNPRPLILRPNLQNEKLRFDNLKLTPMLRAELRNIGFIAARGGDAPIVFVEADEMHDAITISGGYTVEGDDLTITAVLVKNDKPFGEEIKVSGKATEKENILKRLIAEMIRVAK